MPLDAQSAQPSPQLEPEAEAYLAKLAKLGAKPRHEMTIAETRQAMVAARRWQRMRLEPVHVVDAEVPATERSAPLPVRLYNPPSNHAVLYLHGGRFFSGNLDSHDLVLRDLALESGCHICAVDYRLAPEAPFPAALEDAVRAARWLDISVDRMVVVGDSAGGNLAAALTVCGEAPPICAQVLLYPMLDATCGSASYQTFAHGPWPSGEDMRRGWAYYLPEATDREDPRISPFFAPHYSHFPATHLLTAGVDPLRDEAFQFAHNLREAGVAVEHLHEAGMMHGFFTVTHELEAARRALSWTAQAIRQALWP